MNSSRRDAVIRVRIHAGPQQARHRARMQRDIEHAKRRGHPVARVVRARVAARGASRLGSLVSRTSVATRLASAAVLSATVAALVAVRLASGRSYSSLGAAVREELLGLLPAQARADARARDAITGDPQLARILGSEDRINSQVKLLYDDARQHYFREARGRDIIEADARFQANDRLDMLVLRFRDAFLSLWRGSEIPQKLDAIRELLQTKAGVGPKVRR